MLALSILNRISVAFFLSFAALCGSVAVQGNFLFREELSNIVAPKPIRIRQFSLADENQAALAVFTIYSPFGLSKLPQTIAGIFDLTAGAPVFQPLHSRSSPWTAAAASRRGYGFLSTENGELFWFDMVSPSRQPVYFGTHQAGHPARMACTDDGSLVVVASSNTTAWDRQAAKLLWRREAPIVEACQFLPRSRRLICSLATGEIVELDPLTGDVLRLIDRYPYPITHLGVAPGGDRLAAVNSHKVCVLADLETGGAIWSRQFSWVATGPQFSPDGRTLLVPNPEEGVEIAEVSSVSGKTVGTLSGVGGHIMALRVTDDGTVYAWNDRGTITAWSLANRTITRQFTPSAIEQELTP